jgi:hypothetical protein
LQRGARQIIAKTTWAGAGSWSRLFLAVGIALSIVRRLLAPRPVWE